MLFSPKWSLACLIALSSMLYTLLACMPNWLINSNESFTFSITVIRFNESNCVWFGR